MSAIKKIKAIQIIPGMSRNGGDWGELNPP
jgi:hypothetical protein